MSMLTVTAKGQVTLRKDILRHLGVSPGDRITVDKLPDGRVVNHTLGVGSLGGATLDNEENYLIKKLFAGGLGLVNVENQARI